MRIPSRFAADRGRLDVQMTPMIDVVFLLLVFFVWTASFQIVERLLPSNLLASGTGAAVETTLEELDFERVVIQLRLVGDRPAWTVNGTPAESLAHVRSTLAAVARVQRVRAEIPVVIDPGSNVPLGHVIDVFDAARGAGFDKIQFAASEDV